MAAQEQAPNSRTDGLFDFEGVQGFANGYIDTYYRQPPTNDERAAIGFFHRMLNQFPLPRLANGLIEHIDAACGPTLHHALPVTPHVDSILMGDYLPENLDQVRKWVNNSPDAHPWSQYTEMILQLEGDPTPSREAIIAREDLTRSKISGLLHCDFLRPQVLDDTRQFSSVGCFYGTEEVGVTKEAWAEVVGRLTQIVVPGGVLFLAILGETDSYAVHDADGSIRRLPAAYLVKDDVVKVISQGPFDHSQTVIEEAGVAGQHAEGVNKVLLVAARRRT